MSIQYNHPKYKDIMIEVDFMRDSIEGEVRMKEKSEEKGYLRLPASSLDSSGLDWAKQKFRNKNRLEYIKDAEYPEIVARSIDFAVSTVLSSPYKIENAPKEFNDKYLDSLDSDGRTFFQLVQHYLREQFSTPAQGILVDYDKENNRDVLVHYSREYITNWKTKRYGKLNLIVFEEERMENIDPYSHDYNNTRLALRLEGNSVVMERYYGDSVDHSEINSKLEKKYLHKTNNRLNTFNQTTESFSDSEILVIENLDELPVFIIGDLNSKKSIFGPLANSCVSYFKRSAELNHALHWAASPQPYIKFEDGGGFYGTGDSELNSEIGSSDSEVILEWGSPVPLVLDRGDIRFAQVNNSGIPFILAKLDKLVDVIAGTGARAFSAKIGSNITAETQRLQQYSENSIISMHVKMVEDTLTKILRYLAKINKIDGYENIKFTFSKDTGIDDFNTENIKELRELYKEELLAKEHIWEYLKLVKYIPESQSIEDIKKMINDNLQDRVDFDLME